jgi:hypothetical protein
LTKAVVTNLIVREAFGAEIVNRDLLVRVCEGSGWLGP